MSASGHTPILLVLSTTRQSPATVDHALRRATEENEPLHVLFILDSDMPGSIFDRLTDMGFMGERPSQQLSDAILSEYRERGSAKIAEIEKAAGAHHVSVTTALLAGDFLCTCLNEIARLHAAEVVLTRRHRGNLSRFLFGSAVTDLKLRASCPVTIIEEE